VTLALFFVIKGINKLHQMSKRKKPNKENEEMIQLEANEEVKVLCEIRDLLAKQSLVVR
jgi:large-conductance mechanosensitive channel